MLYLYESEGKKEIEEEIVLGIEDDNKNEGRNHEVASVFMID
jgi:hypothetical protein